MVSLTVTRRPFYTGNELLALSLSLHVINVESYPVTSVLGDIFTNLLGRQTKRTDLGGQSRLGSDLTTSHTEVAIEAVSVDSSKLSSENLHNLHLIGVELRSYPMGIMLVASLRESQGDDTYAWRVRKVVNRPWNVDRG